MALCDQKRIIQNPVSESGRLNQAEGDGGHHGDSEHRPPRAVDGRNGEVPSRVPYLKLSWMRKLFHNVHMMQVSNCLGPPHQVADSVEKVVSERERDGKFGREDRGAAELHRLQRREGVPEIPLCRQRKNRGSWRDKISLLNRTLN